jgi:hypothetical protein
VFSLRHSARIDLLIGLLFHWKLINKSNGRYCNSWWVVCYCFGNDSNSTNIDCDEISILAKKFQILADSTNIDTFVFIEPDSYRIIRLHAKVILRIHSKQLGLLSFSIRGIICERIYYLSFILEYLIYVLDISEVTNFSGKVLGKVR